MIVWLVYDWERYGVTVDVFSSEGAVRDWIARQGDPSRYGYAHWVVLD